MSALATNSDLAQKDSGAPATASEAAQKSTVAGQVTGHGRGDRSEYYQKWDQIAADALNGVEAEEEQEKKQSDAALGLSDAPLSEAEKLDREKREALKRAKKHWDGMQGQKEEQKIVISDESKLDHRVIDFSTDLQGRRVIVLKNNEDCSYVLSPALNQHKIIKLFIDGCARCTIEIHCALMTSCIEISHCENICVSIRHPTMTFQVDLSHDISLQFGQNVFTDKTKIYHAACRALSISHDVIGDTESADSVIVDDFDLSNLEGQAAAEEQFLTRYFNGALVTDLVVRDAGNHPTTARDIAARKQRIHEALREHKIDVNSPEAQVMLAAEDQLTPLRHASNLKEEAKKAFMDRNYSQASADYTQAILALNSESPEHRDMLCVLLSNRAACELKLGRLETALADAEEGLRLDGNHVKCLFRKGMALHAMKRYEEAIRPLAQAEQLQPSNKQIKTAIEFCARKMRMQSR